MPPTTATLAQALRAEAYGTPVDEITLDDCQPELEDCGAGLSDDSLLHWPLLAER